MNKKLLSLVLALVMCLGLCVPAFATWETNVKPMESVKVEHDFITIAAGETEGKSEKYGQSCTLSQPVISVETKKDWYDQEAPLHLVPFGTVITLTNADGTIKEQCMSHDEEGGGFNVNPYTVAYEDELMLSWGDVDTETYFYFKGVKVDEAGDTTPAPDAKPDETKPEDAKPDETKPDDAKPDETKPEETTSDDAKPVETNPEETKPVENPFTDVKEGDYFYEPVLWAVEKEITTGTTDTTFTPERDCTVSEILTFLWRAAGSPEAAIENPYTDGTENAWYADAAIWAHEKGMVTGETFPADEPCTRASTAVYLWQAAGSPEAEKAAEFTDVAADADYAAAVAWAVENAVTTGTSETTFSPDSTCTRGQIATFLYRAFADQQ